MILTEETGLPVAVLPVAALRAQIGEATGFGTPGFADAPLERALRTAIAVIEARIGRILIARGFRLRLRGWAAPDRQPLPLTPVREIAALTLLDRAGQAVPVPPERWRLWPDRHQPLLLSNQGSLPAIPPGGAAEILFEAGFGPAFGDVPADLAQAVLLLAAQAVEMRSPLDAPGAAGVPDAVGALLAPWRLLRLTALPRGGAGPAGPEGA